MKIAITNILLVMICFSAAAQDKLIKIDDFKSDYVMSRNVEIWLPKEYYTNPDKKFPVLYMHDGQNVFNPETAMGNIAWEADNAARKLIDSGSIAPVIIVASWCTPLRYFEYFPEKAGQYLTAADKEAMQKINSERGGSNTTFYADEYLRFIVKELKPYIDKNYRTLSDRTNTAICGSSMGGLISLYALCEYPKVFGQAACISTHWPVLFNNDNMSPSEAIRKYMNQNLPKAGNHRIYFDLGTETLDQYYSIHQEKVDDIIRNKGYTEGTDWVTLTFKGAAHNEKSWQERMDVILKFLYER